MQEPNTGKMIEVSEEIAQEAETRGYCILTKGETLTVRGETFTVFNFDKKGVILEKKNEKSDFIVGERVSFKGGLFKVYSIGRQFINFKGLPSNKIIDHDLLDKIKKDQIKKLRKETIKKENI